MRFLARAACGLGIAIWAAPSAGCGRERAERADATERGALPAPIDATACEAVLGQLRRVLTVELARIPGATAPLGQALAIGARSCSEDSWPAPVRRCILDVPLVGAPGGAVPALLRCAELLPSELRARLERDVRDAIR